MRGCLQPVEHLDRRGAGVGLFARTGAQFDDAIGFLGPCGQQPARAVVFERSPDQPHVIGQQGRGQRIAGMGGIAAIVEPEVDSGVAVDLTAAQSVALGHFDRPRARATSRASSTLEISCVVVSRVTTSHDRSPAS